MTETVIPFTYTQVNKDVVEVVWTGLDGDDSGQAVDLSAYPDKAIQVYGTFDSATTTLYWSNDTAKVKTDRAAGTLFSAKTASWIIAQDSLGNNIAKSAAGGDQILEAGHWFMPVNAGGGGSTSLTVIVTARRNKI